MATEIIIAILSLVGTALGSVLGIITSNRLTMYRIQQLEEKVNKHNNLVERVALLEQSTKLLSRQMDEIAEGRK